MSGSYFSEIFSKSPVTPLQEHMEKVVACVSELEPFFQAVLAEDDENVAKHYKNIVVMETEGDVLKKELRLRLPSSLFLPVDRRDILEVLTMQDMVAGSAKDVASVIHGRRMRIPKTMAKTFKKLIKKCVAAGNQALLAISELDELIETGFGKSERKRVGHLLLKLDKIEHAADELELELRDELLLLENELHPINTVFLYKVIENTGKIADRAQRVGSRLQLMLAR